SLAEREGGFYASGRFADGMIICSLVYRSDRKGMETKSIAHFAPRSIPYNLPGKTATYSLLQYRIYRSLRYTWRRRPSSLLFSSDPYPIIHRSPEPRGRRRDSSCSSTRL